jgi:signal transduction histidine kinase
LKRRNLGWWISKVVLSFAVSTVAMEIAMTEELRPPVIELIEAQDFGDYSLAVPPPLNTPWQRISLPKHFPLPTVAQARINRWVRVPFHLEPLGSGEFAVYLPHIAPGAAISVNGIAVGSSEQFGKPNTSTWYYPLYISVPRSLLRDGDNDLLVRIVPPSFDEFRMSTVWIGDASVLQQRYSNRLRIQALGVEVVSILTGAVGLLTLTLWIRRRFDTVFGWFSLSCALWILRNSQFYVVNMHSTFYFWVVTDAALFWLVAVLYVVTFRVTSGRYPRVELSLYGYAILTTLAMYLAGPSAKSSVTTISYLLLFPASLAFMSYLTRQAVRSPSVLRWLLWLAALATGASGTYDTAVMIGWQRLPEIYLMPYAALFYTFTVGWALVDRFIKIHNDTELLNRDLEVRVRQREQQLVAQYEATAELAREQAISGERDRILRDMHDGLGLHLITARRLIEAENVSQGRIASLLGDAMDELRIAIDSMKPSAEELLVMLGNLRYRLEPRLNAAGIQLHWELDRASEMRSMSPTLVTEVTRIVQELCTNAIKHSQATDMFLTVVALENSALRISISDNGVGFDANTVRQGEGLRNIRRRAQHIGAILEIRSHPGETMVSLILGTPESRLNV